jgi:hypothetical protein
MINIVLMECKDILSSIWEQNLIAKLYLEMIIPIVVVKMKKGIQVFLILIYFNLEIKLFVFIEIHL